MIQPRTSVRDAAPRRPRLCWALVKAVWAMAACTAALAVYAQSMPRFY